MKPLYGKYGLVTGASRGIGRAIAETLGDAGAMVGVGYNSDYEGAMLVVEGIQSAVPIQLAVESISPDTLEQRGIGPLDFLVNNAGITAGRSARKMTDEDWKRVLDVNLTGTMKMTRAVLPGMIERGYGRIVNITSVVGLDGRLGPSSYAAAKAGIVGYTKAVAHEVAGRGITVNAVMPGFIADTGMIEQVPEQYLEKIKEQIPLGRLGKPQDIANAALYLIALGGYVTGTVLNVSGGYST